VLKQEHFRITTAGEEVFRATALRPKFNTFSWRKLTVRKVKPRSTIHVNLLSKHYRGTVC